MVVVGIPPNLFMGDEICMVYEAIKQKLQEASVAFVDHEHEPNGRMGSIIWSKP